MIYDSRNYRYEPPYMMIIYDIRSSNHQLVVIIIICYFRKAKMYIFLNTKVMPSLHEIRGKMKQSIQIVIPDVIYEGL